jgi:hypothetical protein
MTHNHQGHAPRLTNQGRGQARPHKGNMKIKIRVYINEEYFTETAEAVDGYDALQAVRHAYSPRHCEFCDEDNPGVPFCACREDIEEAAQ